MWKITWLHVSTCPVPDFQSLNQAHRLHSFRSGTCGFGVGKVVHSEKSDILSKFCCMRTATKSITVADDWSLLFTYEQWHVMTAQRSWGMSSMHLSHHLRALGSSLKDETMQRHQPTENGNQLERTSWALLMGSRFLRIQTKNPGESEFE